MASPILSPFGFLLFVFTSKTNYLESPSDPKNWLVMTPIILGNDQQFLQGHGE